MKHTHTHWWSTHTKGKEGRRISNSFCEISSILESKASAKITLIWKKKDYKKIYDKIFFKHNLF